MRLFLLTSSIIGIGLESLLRQRWPESQILLSSASDPKQIVPEALGYKPDVTLIDGDHLAAVPLFQAQLGHLWVKELGRILIITACPSEQELFEALRYGVMAYLSSYSDGQTLLSAIEEVHQGRYLLNSDILSDPLLRQRRSQLTHRQELVQEARAVREEVPPAEASPPNSLGAQEQEMLLLAARGKTNKEIAEIKGLRAEAVKRCFTRIFSILQVSGRTEAVVQAWRYGWITPETHRAEAAL